MGFAGLKLRATGGLLAALTLGGLLGCSTRAAAPAPAASPEAAGVVSAEPLRSALERVNKYRTMARLPAVVEDRALSDGCAKHSRYLVKNRLTQAGLALTGGGMPAGLLGESQGNAWFSREGLAATRRGYAFAGGETPKDGRAVVDLWMTMPLRSLLVLDPQLAALGYGSYCEANDCAAMVSGRFGLEKAVRLGLFEGSAADLLWNPHNGPIPQSEGRLRSPVEFPPNGSTVAVVSYSGQEWPDPLASCPGYAAPTGHPMTLQIGKGSNSDGSFTVSAHSFSSNGQPLDHCVFDAATYANPTAYEQSLWRSQLAISGTVVLIPRAPLVPGASYAVSITADSKTYEWSFEVAQNAPKPATLEARAAPPGPVTEPGTTADGAVPQGGGAWLSRVNYYRTAAKLRPVAENPAQSEGDRNHARYVVMNYWQVLKNGGNVGGAGHSKDRDNKWYTAAGLAAAGNSNVAMSSRPLSNAEAIDEWIAGPFHRLQILSPALRQAGYGSFGQAGKGWAAALYLDLAPGSRRLIDPIRFPADGSTTNLGFAPGEWPDPLASCPGYTEPAGLPVTLQFGWNAVPAISAHSLSEAGRPLEHCIFTGATYRNPDHTVEAWGRRVLRSFGAVVLIPRQPLAPGNSYYLSITAYGKKYAWSFKVAPTTRAAR